MKKLYYDLYSALRGMMVTLEAVETGEVARNTCSIIGNKFSLMVTIENRNYSILTPDDKVSAAMLAAKLAECHEAWKCVSKGETRVSKRIKPQQIINMLETIQKLQRVKVEQFENSDGGITIAVKIEEMHPILGGLQEVIEEAIESAVRKKCNTWIANISDSLNEADVYYKE